ncbi:cytochrome oxidase c assembly-domain-containing protein [Podospora fimiseda]|uniref:Cytochrome oxidase c assembly-domain-containing protein n=1 Tax=Podospora fimiseda TaxID=252190 RepID=A0AAN7GWD4_9PEZI|nr:cytochrome oxidase c assembly-domain-containing protein [Podospora fimiseda]
MAKPIAPRSVKDATRFTATTPHASSKTAAAKLQAAKRPHTSSSPQNAAPTKPLTSGSSAAAPGVIETPEQKVARLRAAHQRAKLAQVSKLDQVIDFSRKAFDKAHRFTVISLVGFTAVAGLVTVYTAVDMMTYNKKRKAEWLEAQLKLEADSLEAARLAYLTGNATDEQVSLVEEQLERERKQGITSGSFFDKMPNVLAPASAAKPSVTESVAWPAPQQQTEQEEEGEGEKKSSSGGVWAWLTSNLKNEDEGDSAPNQNRLGFESLSEEDDSTGVRESDLVRAVEKKKAYLREKARQAFEKEKEKERKGGPLDRIGIVEEKPVEVKKKGWWPW